MIKLIVGLGNPGQEYAKTRHNAGFWFLDALNQSWNMESKLHGLHQKALLQGQAVHLLKPQTFMNASGRAVLAAAQYYRIEPESILVVHDELDLPEGSIKLKLDGGHGGHNGLRDIIQALGSKRFYRLRIGIDHPGHKSQVASYVLKPTSASGQANIDTALQRGLQVLPILLKEGAERAMHVLHTEEKK